MTVRQLLLFSTFSLSLVAAPHTSYSDIVVENLFLQCRVTDQISVTEFFDIANPAPQYLSHTATHGLSYCDGGYDSQWAGDSATFDVTMDHRLQGFRGSVTSGGRWLVRPAVDSIVTFDGFFHYSHPTTPNEWGQASINVTLRVEGSTSFLFVDQEVDGTVSLGPPSSTLTVNGSYLLQAGTLYRVGYSFGTLNFQSPPPPTATWLGNGEVHIAINPVPEPAAAMLLVSVLPVALSRPIRRVSMNRIR
ncbi:hypothetical protein RAS2_02620 [Phycisphaerae bacterium RAS2]|nr:hypothetical protein RAS2_02620 [Phycisphaerae bacterium RAS2]